MAAGAPRHIVGSVTFEPRGFSVLRAHVLRCTGGRVEGGDARVWAGRGAGRTIPLSAFRPAVRPPRAAKVWAGCFVGVCLQAAAVRPPDVHAAARHHHGQGLLPRHWPAPCAVTLRCV